MHCHRLGMWINCQRRVAAATVPLSGTAYLTICVLFMTPVSATALVAIPLLSLPATGHGILAIGMSITPLSVFDHHYSLLPRFGSEVEPPFPFVLSRLIYCLGQAATYLLGPIVGRQLLSVGSYCLILLIVLCPSEDRTAIAIV